MDDCWQYQSFFALGLGFSVLHHSASESMLTSPNTFDTWNVFEPAGSTTYSGDTRVTWRNETLHQHAQENYNRDLLLVQDLERKLSISRRWVPEDKEWQDAGRLVANREYRRALDNLESLVVAQLFELTKMNRAGTGYKLWKHIAKALQTCSTAIKVTLDRYNKCALAV
ncbi:hypothetical protein EDD15DRAFT_2359803 [Pisolithus albus]|nr:hypothetical protein EDD15DRAFT_2359803 [Pisolithus albus]